MKIIINGVGHAGTGLVRSIGDISSLTIQAGVCRTCGRKVGKDLGILSGTSRLDAPILPLDRLEAALRYYQPDVIVDFSSPETSLQVARLCSKYGIGLLVGTTGFTPDEVKEMKALAMTGQFALLYVPNIGQDIEVLRGEVCYTARHFSGLDFQTLSAKEGVPAPITSTVDGDDQPSDSSPLPAREASAPSAQRRVVVIRESKSTNSFAGNTLAALRNLKGKKGWMEMVDVVGFR